MVNKIALAQSGSVLGDKSANLERAHKDIEISKDAGVALVIFPEMFLTGYAMIDGQDYDTVWRLAEPLNGPCVVDLIQTAKQNNMYVVMGMPLKSDLYRGVIYNAAVLIGPEGVVGCHHKIGLPTGYYVGRWFYEGNYFMSGSQIKVFDTELGRIGMMICYEAWWPEIARTLALKGAEHIICISAGPDNTEQGFDLVLPVRAIENSVFLTYVNQPNIQKGIPFFGGSRTIDPTGAVVGKSGAKYAEDLVIVEIDLQFVESARNIYPNIRDTVQAASIWKEMAQLYGRSSDRVP